MEFRLLYEGRLLGASRTDSRAKIKHEIRREFHPQLRQLWTTHHGLDEYARHKCGPWFQREKPQERNPEAFNKMTNEQFRQIGLRCISEKWERGGFKFVPLITEEVCDRCSLDILFLRPDEPRFIMQSGDLDARLKTLFDALRIPKNTDETGGTGPQEDEHPFFVLLEDDKLISSVSVTTDRLLVLPHQRVVNANDVFLVINVRMKPLFHGLATLYDRERMRQIEPQDLGKP